MKKTEKIQVLEEKIYEVIEETLEEFDICPDIIARTLVGMMVDFADQMDMLYDDAKEMFINEYDRVVKERKSIN
jgi:hypothetical protein